MNNWKILELAIKTADGTVMNEVYKNGELQTSLTYNEALIYVDDHRIKGENVIIEYVSGRTVEFEPELAIARSWQ